MQDEMSKIELFEAKTTQYFSLFCANQAISLFLSIS